MTCTKCDGTTADGIYLDEPCQQALWTLLGQIPDTLTDAEDTVARLDARRGTGRSTQAGAPVNLEASQRVDELRGLLVSWSRMVYEETGQAGDAGADYLRHAWQHIIGQDWAGDMLDELDRAHRRVVECVDVPPEVRTFGTCHDPECGGQVRSRGASNVARCRECGAIYHVPALIATGMESADREVWLNLNQVYVILSGMTGGPSRKTVYNWAQSGRLPTVMGEDGPVCKPSSVAAVVRELGVDTGA